MNKKFFITTPIYYVNDIPHVGHTYTTLAADVIARYYRLLDYQVFFLTGTDEHGQKIAEAAKKNNQSPKEYCDNLAPQFQKAWKDFNFSFDFFIRTTDPRHEKVVREILKKIYDNGFIYKGKYQGFYCVGCEKFLMEDDLVNNRCPYHPNLIPEKQEEENYFFKLSFFRDKLIRAISNKNDKNHYEILPEERKNEILGKLKKGLKDISISRKEVSWGITLPWDKTQTTYVWVEALFNYYSATQFLKDKKNFWPPDLHLMAKDILWFHSVIWEALLLAADLPLPKKILAHGFFTVNNQKMSKTLGNVISPEELIKNFGVDGSRYLLLSAFPFGQDGDINLLKFKSLYNNDLANNLGNLVSRVAKLCEKADLFINPKVKKISEEKFSFYRQLIENYQFNEGLSYIFKKIADLNKEIDKTSPWTLLGEKKNNIRFKKLLAGFVEEILEIAILLEPFLPETTKNIKNIFLKTKIISPSPLFKRLI